MNLELTFCDQANNSFVALAHVRFDDVAKLREAWASIPGTEADTAFLVDLDEGEGMVDNKYVTAEWIERTLGRPISDVIADGRVALRADLDALALRYGWAAGTFS